MNFVHKSHAVFLRKNLSFRLRYYSSLCNVDQKEVASDIGIDPCTLSRLLNGKYSCGIDMFLAVADRYGLEVKLVPKYE